MEAPRVPVAAAALLGLVTAMLVLGSPASADMHAACDTQNPDAEGAFGPAGYANTFLHRDGTSDALVYGGAVYCPGAVISFESVTLTELEAYEGPRTVATTSGDQPCTASPTAPCEVSDGVGYLTPGTYAVEMVFDADDPNTPGLEYDDTVRRQTFRHVGSGVTVVSCPDAGYVHANPPLCP